MFLTILAGRFPLFRTRIRCCSIATALWYSIFVRNEQHHVVEYCGYSTYVPIWLHPL
jgi:hypothetical protein